jgi:seryl-tRNA synthetase
MQQFKGSTDLLNMRQQEQHSARQKKYQEAH